MFSLWNIAGREDSEFLVKYMLYEKKLDENLSNMIGVRLRNYFSYDQLETAIEILKENRDFRYPLITYDVENNSGGLDCADIGMIVNPSKKELDLTIISVNHDIGNWFWNYYPSLAVIQEYLSFCIGCEVGSINLIIEQQFSLSDEFALIMPLADETQQTKCPYEYNMVKPFPLISTDPSNWLSNLQMFLDVGPVTGLNDRFFRRVAVPIELAHKAAKERKDVDGAIQILRNNCQAEDWRDACIQWLEANRTTLQAG